MGPHRMPAAELDVSADLVQRLLAAQQPDLADLAVEVMANGWDNVMYRVGDVLVARLPRREAAAGLIVKRTAVAAGSAAPAAAAGPGTSADRAAGPWLPLAMEHRPVPARASRSPEPAG